MKFIVARTAPDTQAYKTGDFQGASAKNACVDLCLTGDAFSLQASLNVSLPGLESSVARAVADGAHQICPYSKATRGNIDVTINVV